MTVERIVGTAVAKPWGSLDLGQWGRPASGAGPIGEIWFQRESPLAAQPLLLLKLLFTTEPLSLQVHPDDAFARRMGLANGKTEAWYILAAGSGASVGVGLTANFNKAQMLEAIEDGSIENHINWVGVMPGDVVYVPAGTIHAIGPDLVIAEIQQASDTTYRLFDYGRSRPIHPQAAVNSAKNARADIRHGDLHGDPAKRLLVACPHFTFVAIDLPAVSLWTLRAGSETWLLGLAGDADFGGLEVGATQALFIEDEQINLTAGPVGFRALVATASSSAFATLLTRVASAFPPKHDSVTRAAKRTNPSAENLPHHQPEVTT